MTEQEANGIIPDTLKTQVAENRFASRSGHRIRRWATTADGFDGQKYILLGTPWDLAKCAENESLLGNKKPSLSAAFRHQGTFLSHLSEDLEVDLSRVKSDYADGDSLIIGPGNDPATKRLWAPAELVAGDEWTIIDPPTE